MSKILNCVHRCNCPDIRIFTSCLHMHCPPSRVTHQLTVTQLLKTSFHVNVHSDHVDDGGTHHVCEDAWPQFLQCQLSVFSIDRIFADVSHVPPHLVFLSPLLLQTNHEIYRYERFQYVFMQYLQMHSM